MKPQLLKALDLLGLALVNQGHIWTKEERTAYEKAGFIPLPYVGIRAKLSPISPRMGYGRIWLWVDIGLKFFAKR